MMFSRLTNKRFNDDEFKSMDKDTLVKTCISLNAQNRQAKFDAALCSKIINEISSQYQTTTNHLMFAVVGLALSVFINFAYAMGMLNDWILK